MVCYSIEMITSPSNTRIQNLRKVIREPREWPVFAVEGVRALEEAVRAGVRVESVFYSDRLEATPRGLTLLDSLVRRGAEKVHVSESALGKVTATEQDQGVIAVVPKLGWTLEDIISPGHPVFILDGVRDPGNLGTILRIADAFDLGGVIATDDTVDAYNQKVIRGAMGSLFRVPLVYGGVAEAVGLLRDEGFTILRAEAGQGTPVYNLTERERVAVVLGNEAHGVRGELGQLVDDAFHIPMPGPAESLNVGITAGIVAYELAS